MRAFGVKPKEEELVCAGTREAGYKKKRKAYVKEIPKLSKKRLIFIDESGAHRGMCRLYGRSLKGRRLKASQPYPRGNKYSMIGAISQKGLVTGLQGRWSVDGDIFTTFINQCLKPKLKLGDIVVMDNINFHKSLEVAREIEKRGAEIKFLPPYSPEYSPIECMWSKVKSHIRKVSPKTDRSLSRAIGEGFRLVTGRDTNNWFKHCGY